MERADDVLVDDDAVADTPSLRRADAADDDGREVGGGGDLILGHWSVERNHGAARTNCLYSLPSGMWKRASPYFALLPSESFRHRKRLNGAWPDWLL